MIKFENNKWIVIIEGYKELRLVPDLDSFTWDILIFEKRFVAETKGDVAKMLAEEIAYISILSYCEESDDNIFCFCTEDKIKLYDHLERLVEFPCLEEVY